MATFCVEGLKHLFQIGTVVPSSRWLARAMTRPLGRNGSPRRILEVGPGTGAITKMILSQLNDGDELQLVEINPAFCRHVERRLLRPLRLARPDLRVEIHCESITSAPLTGTFDTVICTLPFRAFSPAAVRAIFGRLGHLMSEDGVLTYMQFVGIRSLQSPFVSRSRRRELGLIEITCRCIQRHYAGSRELVPLNILPSYVTQLAKGEIEAPLEGRFSWTLDRDRESPGRDHARRFRPRRRRRALSAAGRPGPDIGAAVGGGGTGP